jgi:sugar/nucleoside kinase (ribokinase family)
VTLSRHMRTQHSSVAANPTPRIAGAGLLALDIVLREPHEAGALTFAGGTCGNVLAILSFLRWTATPVGFIGNDSAGKRVLTDLTAVGVRGNHLIQSSEWITPIFIQHLKQDPQGQPHHTFTNSSRCPSCGHVLARPQSRANRNKTPIREFETSERVDAFFMDRLSDDILSLAESAKSQGALVFYEPSVQSDADYWASAFPLVDIVKYSADRFAEEDFAPFLARHAQHDVWEVKTLGAKGLHYRKHARSAVHISQWAASEAVATKQVVDTCGAGDWCSAGLLHGLVALAGNRTPASFRNALRLGQTLAAWACAFVGARGAMYGSEPAAIRSVVQECYGSHEFDLSRLPSNLMLPADVSLDAALSCVPGLCATRL